MGAAGRRTRTRFCPRHEGEPLPSAVRAGKLRSFCRHAYCALRVGYVMFSFLQKNTLSVNVAFRDLKSICSLSVKPSNSIRSRVVHRGGGGSAALGAAPRRARAPTQIQT